MPGRPATQIVRGVEASDAIDFSGKTVYNDFRDDLVRDGFAIIKEAVPAQKAAEYVDQIQTWLEDFNLGYKRDDPSTVQEEMLPVINEKGMVQHYGISHEQFVWDVRTEPGVVGAFEKVYDTEDLLVSFDAVNVSFPNRKDIPENKKWAHQDQDPERPGFRCLQGLVNLAPCGDNDGGLIIMKGAHKISQEYHDTFRNEERIWQWTNEWYGYKETGLAWLKERGFEFEKVNCGPGDMIIWDSRCPHYNVSPTGSQTRFVVYACYGPASTATQEDLIKKKAAYESYIGSSHWPQNLQNFGRPCLRKDGTLCTVDRVAPKNPPQLNKRGFKLTGIPYISSSA